MKKITTILAITLTLFVAITSVAVAGIGVRIYMEKENVVFSLEIPTTPIKQTNKFISLLKEEGWKKVDIERAQLTDRLVAMTIQGNPYRMGMISQEATEAQKEISKIFTKSLHRE